MTESKKLTATSGGGARSDGNGPKKLTATSSSPHEGEGAAARSAPAGGGARSEGNGSKKLIATLRKSSIGGSPSIKATVVSLGFRRMHQTKELPDNAAVRGMLKTVAHLVAVEGEPYDRPKRSRYKIWRSRSDKKHKRGN